MSKMVDWFHPYINMVSCMYVMIIIFTCSKDVNGFFAFPVTDAIAPGYSSIILHPMDFSTMQVKVDTNEYRSVMEYKVLNILVFSLTSFLLLCGLCVELVLHLFSHPIVFILRVVS